MNADLWKKLHDALGQELLDRINNGEATASDLSVARAFLKDNEVTSTPEGSKALADLKMVLPFDGGEDEVKQTG